LTYLAGWSIIWDDEVGIVAVPIYHIFPLFCKDEFLDSLCVPLEKMMKKYCGYCNKEIKTIEHEFYSVPACEACYKINLEAWGSPTKCLRGTKTSDKLYKVIYGVELPKEIKTLYYMESLCARLARITGEQSNLNRDAQYTLARYLMGMICSKLARQHVGEEFGPVDPIPINLPIDTDKVISALEEIGILEDMRRNYDAEAYYNQGLAYATSGDYQKAIVAYKEAIRLKPNDADAHCNLGNAYARSGDYQKAIESLEEAIRLKPDDAEAHYLLGLAYLGMGNRKSALTEHNILKDLDKELANDLLSTISKIRGNKRDTSQRR
jgi:tetratricopeptide (TPR) repeat protein